VQKKIVEFTNLLRKSGIRVSVAEAIDSFTALDELSVDDREIFQDVLRTTMVKRSEDIPTFDASSETRYSAPSPGSALATWTSTSSSNGCASCWSRWTAPTSTCPSWLPRCSRGI
jgi:uncharacterized protein with von Willebrand factor type A (vWA) domain